jgi:hypothetical protein
MVASTSGTRRPRRPLPKVYATRRRRGRVGFSTSSALPSSSSSQDTEDEEPQDGSTPKTTFAVNAPTPLAVTNNPHNTRSRAKSQSHKQVKDEDSDEEDQPKKKPRYTKPSMSNSNPKQAPMGGQANKAKRGRPRRRASNPGEPSQYGSTKNAGLHIPEADNVSKASSMNTAEAWEELEAELSRQTGELPKVTGVKTQDIFNILESPLKDPSDFYFDDPEIIERQQPNKEPATVRSTGTVIPAPVAPKIKHKKSTQVSRSKHSVSKKELHLSDSGESWDYQTDSESDDSQEPELRYPHQQKLHDSLFEISEVVSSATKY